MVRAIESHRAYTVLRNLLEEVVLQHLGSSGGIGGLLRHAQHVSTDLGSTNLLNRSSENRAAKVGKDASRAIDR